MWAKNTPVQRWHLWALSSKNSFSFAMCAMAHELEINSQGVINEKWSLKLLFVQKLPFSLVLQWFSFLQWLTQGKRGYGKDCGNTWMSWKWYLTHKKRQGKARHSCQIAVKEVTTEEWKIKLRFWSLIRGEQESHKAEMEGRKEFCGALDDKQYDSNMKCKKTAVQEEMWSKQDEYK